MTAYRIGVDGTDVLVDVTDIDAWTDAAGMVADALGGPPVTVTPADGLKVCTDPIVHFNAQQMRKEDA